MSGPARCDECGIGAGFHADGCPATIPAPEIEDLSTVKLSPLGYSGFVCGGCGTACDIDKKGDHAPGCDVDPGDTTPAIREWARAANEQRAKRAT